MFDKPMWFAIGVVIGIEGKGTMVPFALCLIACGVSFGFKKKAGKDE